MVKEKIKNGAKNLAKNSQAGFTILEMMVSLAIIVVVTSVVLLNHSKFKSDIEITNLAYQLALSVREAQVYSISVKQFGSSASAQNFNTPYGLHFNKTDSTSFIFFADSGNGSGGSSDGLYNQPEGENDMFCAKAADSECIEKFTIGRNNKIEGFCAVLYSQNVSPLPCYFGDDTFDPTYLDIKFKRPNPDAVFAIYNNGNYAAGQGQTLTYNVDGGATPVKPHGWAVCLASPEGKKKQVVVYDTGQISVENVDSSKVCSRLTGAPIGGGVD